MEDPRAPVSDAKSRTGAPVCLKWDTSDVVRTCDPPAPVLVDLRSVDPHAGRPAYRTVQPPSLRVRASGLRLERDVEGYLLAWIRLADGQWRALVNVELRSANQQTILSMTLYVQPDAVRPKNEETQ